MGKNSSNSWLNAVKKAFKSPTNDDEKEKQKQKKKRIKTRDENEHEYENKKRGRRRWIFGKRFTEETTIQHRAAKTATGLCRSGQENPAANEQRIKEEDSNVGSFDPQKRAVAVAMAATAAAEAALANAVEIINRNEDFVLAKREEAAVVIQTIFRGYLARRARLALRGVVKMQALIRGHNVRKRAETTLKCMQSLVRVQALVSDQRRRMSCDATTVSKNVSNTSDHSGVDEIQALIQRAKHGNTLAHILSQQTWALEEDQNSDKELNKWNQTTHPTIRKDRYLSIRRPISPHSFTPPKSSKSQSQDPYFIHSSPQKTPSRKPESPTSCSIYLHRTSLGENSCPLPLPNYMAATQSAMARVRPNSTPRQRLSSPNRQQMGPARRRLSFARGDGSSPFRDESRSSVPCYLTE